MKILNRYCILYGAVLALVMLFSNKSYANAVPMQAKSSFTKIEVSKKQQIKKKQFKKQIKKKKNSPNQLQWTIGHTGILIGGFLIGAALAMLIVGGVMGLPGLWVTGLILALIFLLLFLCWLFYALFFGFV